MSASPRRNLEIKARVRSLADARQVASEVATESLGVLHQVDTFFPCAKGRLKVRQEKGRPAELIAYQRPTSPGAKASDYFLIEVADAEGLIAGLTSTLGVGQIVRKRREVFLYRNVRIHLDQVAGLGEFLELESVVGAGTDEETAARRLEELIAKFPIDPADLIAASYAELITAGEQ